MFTQNTPFTMFWRDASKGVLPLAAPIHVQVDGEQREGLVNVSLDPNPTVTAALMHADPRVRAHQSVSLMRDALKFIKTHNPHIEVNL